MDLKRIEFPYTTNCRDLGGYVADGGFIKFHVLYRSDAPNKFNDSDWDKIKNMNVRTIIDLRSEFEVNNANYEVPSFIERKQFSLQKYTNTEGVKSAAELASKAFGKSVLDGYDKMLLESSDNLVSLLKYISERLDEGAILYHCSIGKDRTGILTALIYLICGVKEENIIADYQVSETYIKKNEIVKRIPEDLQYLLKSDASNMEGFLKHFHERNYMKLLEDNGLTEEIKNKIRKYLIQ